MSSAPKFEMLMAIAWDFPAFNVLASTGRSIIGSTGVFKRRPSAGVIDFGRQKKSNQPSSRSHHQLHEVQQPHRRSDRF
jgi:hypothetical protein